MLWYITLEMSGYSRWLAVAFHQDIGYLLLAMKDSAIRCRFDFHYKRLISSKGFCSVKC